MDLSKIDLTQVLYAIKYRMDSQKQVYVNYEVEQMEKKLRAGKIYEEELVLLKVLKERVDSKMSAVSGIITRDQNRLQYKRKEVPTSGTWKGIDVDKVREFIRANEFPDPEFGWDSVEDKIAEGVFKKYLK